MKLPDTEGFICWLLPAEKDADMFRDIIRQLAESHDSFPFEPHITIAGIPDKKIREIKQAVDQISISLEPLHFQFTDVLCGKHPYQKITLAVDQSADFLRVCDKIDSVFGGPFSKRKFPHLSLLYGSTECSSLQHDLIHIRSKNFTKVRINTLALVELKGNPDEWSLVYSSSFK